MIYFFMYDINFKMEKRNQIPNDSLKKDIWTQTEPKITLRGKTTAFVFTSKMTKKALS